MKLTQQDKARLGIDARTIRKWRKDRPYLMKLLKKVLHLKSL